VVRVEGSILYADKCPPTCEPTDILRRYPLTRPLNDRADGLSFDAWTSFITKRQKKRVLDSSIRTALKSHFHLHLLTQAALFSRAKGQQTPYHGRSAVSNIRQHAIYSDICRSSLILFCNIFRRGSFSNDLRSTADFPHALTQPFVTQDQHRCAANGTFAICRATARFDDSPLLHDLKAHRARGGR
jgi:hypothetical protein